MGADGNSAGIRVRGRRVAALPRIAAGQLISWGTLYYSLTFLAEPIQQETHWSLTQIFGAFSGGLLVAAAAAPVVGEVIARWGARSCLTAGSLLASVALTVIAVSPTLVVFTIGWLLAGIAMAATLYEAGFSALRESSGPAFRRQVSTLALIAGLASTLAWPLAAGITAVADWRMALLCFAALNLGLAAPLHWSLPHRERDLDSDRHDRPTRSPALGFSMIGPGLCLAVLAFALSALLSSALSAHLAVLLSAQGIGDRLILWAAVLIGPMQVLARAMDMAWHNSYSTRVLGVLAMGLPPLGVALLLVSSHWPAAVLLFAALYGAGHGLVTIVKAVIPTLLGNEMAYPRLAGWIAAPGLVTRALGPVSTASMIEATDTRVTLVILLTAGLLSVASLLVFFSGKSARSPAR